MKKYLIILLALFGVVQSAFAVDTYWQAPGYNGASFTGTTADAVCRSSAADYISHNTGISYTYKDALLNTAGTSASCRVFYTNNPSASPVIVSTATLVSCTTANPSFNGTNCGPPPPPTCAATDNVSNRDVTVGFATGKDVGSAATYLYKANTDTDFSKASFCIDSCIQKVRSTAGVSAYQEQTPSANGYYRIFAKNVAMTQIGGGQCTVGTNAGQAPDVANTAQVPSTPNTFNGKCPTGTVPGGQSPDGMTICVGTATQPASSSSTTTKAPTTTSTDAAGNSVSTDSTTQTNADGSKTTVTTTTTTAPDGTKTVAVSSNTTAATGGAPGTTDKPDQPKDMCAAHPELTVCHNSQVMGACAQVTCDGDAIQCATLRAAATIQCQQQSDINDLKAAGTTSLGNSVLSGSDPQQGGIDAMKAGSTVDLSSNSLDQTGFLSGGSCLAPMSMTVRGHSFTYAFDSICSNIQPIRAVMLLLAFICAYMIVSKSVLQS